MDTRSRRVWTTQILGIAGGAAIIAASLLFDPRTDTGIAGITAVALVAAVWAVMFGRRAFDRSDEFMREGSKNAWYWGGLVGLALSMPVFVFVMMGGLRWFDASVHPDKHAAVAFAYGYGLAIIAQFGGFLVATAIWWRAKQ